MQLAPDPEFLAICREIVAEGRTDNEWSEIESDDMFQSEHYAGGYDATEQAFCFSYYTCEGQEYWFQLTLLEVHALAAGQQLSMDARPAES